MVWCVPWLDGVAVAESMLSRTFVGSGGLQDDVRRPFGRVRTRACGQVKATSLKAILSSPVPPADARVRVRRGCRDGLGLDTPALAQLVGRTASLTGQHKLESSVRCAVSRV
jgi:hypothetical protein